MGLCNQRDTRSKHCTQSTAHGLGAYSYSPIRLNQEKETDIPLENGHFTFPLAVIFLISALLMASISEDHTRVSER
jgi:hypothetical protein